MLLFSSADSAALLSSPARRGRGPNKSGKKRNLISTFKKRFNPGSSRSISLEQQKNEAAGSATAASEAVSSRSVSTDRARSLSEFRMGGKVGRGEGDEMKYGGCVTRGCGVCN